MQPYTRARLADAGVPTQSEAFDPLEVMLAGGPELTAVQVVVVVVQFNST